MSVEAIDVLDQLEDKELLRLSKLLEIRKIRKTFATEHHVNSSGEPLRFKPFPHIRDIYNCVAKDLVLMGSVQSLKACTLDTLIHTPTGWVRNGDLKLGDLVSVPEGAGACAPIVAINNVGVVPIYEVMLSDDRSIRCCADHNWLVRFSKFYKSSVNASGVMTGQPQDLAVYTTRDLIRDFEKGKFTIPLCQPIEKPAKDLILDPYFLGLILGDGGLSGNQVLYTTRDAELVEWLNSYVEQFGLDIVHQREYDYRFRAKGGRAEGAGTTESKKKVKQLCIPFTKLGLWGCRAWEKFVPPQYLESTVKDRFALLQGLLDSDGCATVNGGVRYSTTSPRLARDVQTLVWSLGGICKVRCKPQYDKHKKRHRDLYQFQISHKNPKSLFRLERQRERLPEILGKARTLGPKIVSIKLVGEEEAQCIAVDHPDHLYVAEDYIVTHNTEFLLVTNFAAMYSGLSVFYVLPKVEAKKNYVQTRVDRQIAISPFYKSLMDRGSFDNINVKNFGRGNVVFVSSNVFSEFVSTPASMIIIDELDQCNLQNTPAAWDRVQASPFQFSIQVANPTIPRHGIHAEFLKSDQREWHCPCYGCGRYVLLDWFKTVVREHRDTSGTVVDYSLRDTEWQPSKGRDIYMICPHCNGRLVRESQEGKWIKQNPGSRIAGFHISGMSSLLVDLVGMWRTFQDSYASSHLLRMFYNSKLGLPYEASGAKLTEEMIRGSAIANFNLITVEKEVAHIEGDRHKGPCIMGADIGGKHDVSIYYRTAKGSLILVYAGRIRSHQEFIDLIQRYNVKVAVLDIGPETNFVREIQQSAQIAGECHVWLCKYRPVEGTSGRARFNLADGTVDTDRTQALDLYVQAILRKTIRFPENYDKIFGGDWLKQQLAPVRELSGVDTAKPRFIWTKPSADHQFHAGVYANIGRDTYGGDISADF